jgi:hypothetical protein
MKAATKAKFLADHPHCCFCGGVIPATTIDHQPARVFFDGKRMPDDALYPACAECQDVSRDAEHLMSLLVARPVMNARDLEDWSRRHASIRDRYPEYIADIIPSDDLARELKSQISSPPPGFDPDDIITLDAKLWAPIFSIFGKKLTLAMFYRAMERPLGSSGRMLTQIVPNAHFDADWDAQIHEITVAGPSARHGGQDLSDQMTIRWAYSTGVFCGRITLQSTLTVYGFAAEDTTSPRSADIAHALEPPFSWERAKTA